MQTLSLVQALVAAGHWPTVACYFEYDSGMVERFRETGADVRLMSPDGKRTQGIKATTGFLFKGLRKLVREIKPDVAHVQYMAPGALTILILKMLGVKKIVVTTHTAGDIYGKNGLKMIKFLSKHFIDAFQCITLRAEKSYFGSASLFDSGLKKHFTIYNALPSHIQILDKAKSFDKSTITVGVVSRLAEIKGMDLVIPAFNLAREKDDRLRLLIVGDGALRSMMEKQAEESHYSEDIQFVGRKAQSELQEWYDKIDILLMPSRSEGFGLTAIEGMARGCVPVVANVGGLPEVVIKGCGLLHNPDDIEDMSDRIERVVKGNMESFSRHAIDRAKYFSQENYFHAVRTLYSKI